MKPVDLPVSGLKFRSQKEALEYIRERIQIEAAELTEQYRSGKKDIDKIIRDRDSPFFKLMLDMVNGHYWLREQIARKGSPVMFRLSYRRPESAWAYSLTQYVTFENNPTEERHWQNFSYKKCVESEGTNRKTNLAKTARSFIAVQIAEYRNSRKDNKTYHCDDCKKLGINLDVDHKIDFAIILEMFCSQNNIKEERKLFEELSTQWFDFHKKYAKYQLLCKHCHGEKTKNSLRKPKLRIEFNDAVPLDEEPTQAT